MLTTPLTFSAYQKALVFAVVLGVTTLLPLQASVGNAVLEFIFFRQMSKPSFFLMLAAYSFAWAIFSSMYCTQTFTRRVYLKNLYKLPIVYLILGIVVFASTLVSKQTSQMGGVILFVAAYLDLITVGIFLVYVVSTVKSALSQQPSLVRNRSDLVFYIAGGLIFMGIVLSDLYCSSYSCRQAYLEKKLGNRAFETIALYINSSPRLRQDIGNVESFALKRGSAIKNESFMDYMARVTIEVRGKNGYGYLETEMAGNDVEDIDSLQSKWTYLNIEIYLNSSGEITWSKPFD